jgi:hypothetical protein
MRKFAYLVVVLLLFTAVSESISEEGYGWVTKHVFGEELWDTASLECYNDSTCIAISYYIGHIRVYKTTDSGQTWNIISERDLTPNDQSLPQDSLSNIWNAQSFEDTHFFTTYQFGNVVDWSHDGGKTYKRTTIFENPSTISDLVMYNSQIGMCRQEQTYAITTDGWKTYNYYESALNYKITSPVYFIDENTAAIRKMRINGGHSLSQLDIESGMIRDLFDDKLPNDSTQHPRMYNIYFVNDSIGYATGGETFRIDESRSSSIECFFKTMDGGRSWKVIYKADEYFYKGSQRVAFRDEMNGFAVGKGWLLWTKDGGVTWERGHRPPGLTDGLPQHPEYAGDTPIICNRKFMRYEKVNEDLNAMYFDRVNDETFCPEQDSIRLEQYIELKDDIISSDFFFYGEGVTRHFENNDPDHPLTGFYFHPNLMGPGTYEVGARAFNRGLHSPETIREDSVFHFVVNDSPQRPIITREGNELSTQYDEVTWYRAEWDLWIKNNKAYTPISDQLVYAEYTDGNGCTGRSEVFDFILNPTSVELNKIDDHIKINADNITVIGSSISGVDIYTLTGKLIYHSSGDKPVIPLDNYERGLYFVVVSDIYNRQKVFKLPLSK